jgi:hypothetical protein
MNAQLKKPLETVENDLKVLMADVARATDKAQAAMARLATKSALASSEVESATTR